MFASVFPRSTFSAPTPEVTPEIGTLSSPGRSFGGFLSSNGAVNEAIQVSRAWSTAINWFKTLLDGGGNHLSHHQQQAFEFLIARRHDERLLQEWYADAVAASFECTKEHYLVLTEPWIIDQDSPGLNPSVLSSIQAISAEIEKCLSVGHAQFESVTPAYLAAWLRRLADKIGKTWIAMDLALPYRNAVEDAMADGFCVAMAISSQRNSDQTCRRRKQCACSVDLDLMPIKQMKNLGLGGHVAEDALAKALRKFLNGPASEKKCFRVDWQSQTSCVSRLQDWVRTHLGPAVEHALDELTTEPTSFDESHVQQMADAAVVGLSRARIADFFDLVKAWPHSEGAFEDIRAILKDDNPAHKIYLCMMCEVQLQRRLLHAGASTSDILAIYVNLIHVFEKLDARGVLLEKVSPVMRDYLRTRHDAVNVISQSLLASSDVDAEPSNNPLISTAITVELRNAVQDCFPQSQLLDWDDMNWTPEPIDAGPNHRNSKSKDVLSHILSLYDADEFVKEFETVLAEQLLKSKDIEIARETRVLEVLKSRMEATKLQNLEVMLKDMRDSVMFEKRLRSSAVTETEPTPKEVQAAIPSHGIGVSELYGRFEKRMKRTHFQAILKLVAIKRNELLFPKRGRLPLEPQAASDATTDDEASFEVRILSSSAWPQMQTNTFSLPSHLSQQLEEAEDRFSSMSGQRKLQWRPALGTMSVTLELEDRTVSENDIPAWRGAVIHAFANDEDGQPQTLTAPDLATKLNMDEELVQEAVSYWLAKRVLYQKSQDSFAVLERLDMDTQQEHTTQPVQLEAFSALKSQDAVLRENAAMFEAFIGNMLRNGGPKEIGGMMGITNMMKMVLPTFTYGDEEVLWLLSQMQARGEVTIEGDAWKVSSV